MKTPGRGEADIKLNTKQDFNQKHGIIDKKSVAGASVLQIQAVETINGLGGAENIGHLTNCATRLRVTVRDNSMVESLDYFVSTGAISLVVNGNAVQVIIGLNVPQLREECQKILDEAQAMELTPCPAG